MENVPKPKPDKPRVVIVKGPLFERAIQDAQRYIARLLIKKLDEKPEEVAADK